MINQLIDQNEVFLKKSFSGQQVLPMSEKLDDFISNLLNEEYVVIPSFSQDLNYLLNGGLRKGRLYVLDSPSAHGKSTLSAQIGDFAALNGFKVCYVSYEMSCEQIFSSSISRLGQIDSSLIEERKYLQDSEVKRKFFQALAKYKDEIADNIHIIEADDLFTPNRLSGICKEIGTDLLIVDYLQLLLGGIQKFENPYQQKSIISKIATELKRIARKLNIPVIAISHSNAAYQSMQPGVDINIKALKDLFAIAHSADVIMLLMSNNFADVAGHKNSQLDILVNKFMGMDLNLSRKIKNLAHDFQLNQNTTDTYSRLIITKNRTGKCGEVLLRYKKALHTFEEMNYLTADLLKDS